ncbi:MAG: POTRA domain-containing protein [Pseudomonadota bacterium]|nr:POTRA domain-containing protein [Pseudomonadota bacterium]
MKGFFSTFYWYLSLVAILVCVTTSAVAQIDLGSVSLEIQKKVQPLIQQLQKNSGDLSVADQLLKALMDTDSFEAVEIHRQNGVLRILTRPSRRISQVIIEGNQNITSAETSRIIQVNINDSFDRKLMVEAAKRLKDEYEGLGYLNAIIEVNFIIESKEKVSVYFKIAEGNLCSVKNIIFNTPNKFLLVELNRKAKVYINKRYSSKVIAELNSKLSDYLIGNRYLNTSILAPAFNYNSSRSEVTLSFDVIDPYKIHFLFKGNQPNLEDDLKKSISPETSAQLGFNLGVEAANRVKDYYLKNGYAYVTITQQVKQWEESFRREIHFTINEGAKIRLQRFFVRGQFSKPEDYYSKFIRNHSSEMIEKGYYVERDLENGVKNLATELRNQGYFRAKLQSHSTIESDNRKTVDIQLTLNEGPLTLVDDIIFEGNKSYSKSELEVSLFLRRGGPLHLNDLERSLENIKKFYFDQGFLEMQILGDADSLVSYDKTNTRAQITFRIKEGVKVKVATIVVDGADQTKNSVILRELEFVPGDTLTPEKIDTSIMGLQRLGLFSKIEIDTLQKDTDIPQRTVIVRVIEKNPGVFKFGVGLTNDTNLDVRAYTGISYRNIRGTARAASLRVELNRSVAAQNGKELDPGENYLENKITAGYYEPFLYKNHIDGRVNLTHSETKLRTEEQEPAKIQEANAIDFLLEKDLTKKIKLTWEAYGFTREREFTFGGSTPENRRDIARIGPTLDFDYRDDPFNPTRGHFMRFNLDYSSPKLGSTRTIHFVKMATTVSHYLPVGKSNFIWANSLRSGYVANLSNLSDGGVPSQQTFFLGGRSTIRGFDPQTELIPRAEELNHLEDINDFSLSGDSHFYLIKSEIRFPIYGSLGGVVFYDGGAVVIPGFRFERQYRDSAGFGVRVTTPVGPLNLEIGYKLNRIAETSVLDVLNQPTTYKESKYQIHLSIGSF